MALNLDSVTAKLQRAEEHAQAVKGEAKPWMDDQPFSLTKEASADSRRHSIVLHVRKEPPLRRWSLMISDSVHNLRCTLDHLIYAIAVHESGQEPPPAADSLMFPIADSPKKFLDAGGRLGKLSGAVRSAIESVQPYNRPHPDLPPLLAMLRDFENTDKHKLLRLAFTSVYLGDVGFKWEGGQEVLELYLNAAELRGGSEVVAVTFDRPIPSAEFDRSQFTLIVALWHAKRDPAGPIGSDRSDFVAVIDSLVNEVKTVINIVSAAVAP